MATTCGVIRWKCARPRFEVCWPKLAFKMLIPKSEESIAGRRTIPKTRGLGNHCSSSSAGWRSAARALDVSLTLERGKLGLSRRVISGEYRVDLSTAMLLD